MRWPRGARLAPRWKLFGEGICGRRARADGAGTHRWPDLRLQLPGMSPPRDRVRPHRSNAFRFGQQTPRLLAQLQRGGRSCRTYRTVSYAGIWIWLIYGASWLINPACDVKL